MYHSTSGKNGYRYVGTPRSVATTIPKNVMKQILIRENELRLSRQYHELISQQESLAWIRDTTVMLQIQALSEHGYSGQAALRALQAARVTYLNDNEMNKLTVYQRMDRSREGDLVNNSPLPNVTLSYLDGTTTTLRGYLDKRKDKTLPVALMAGSIT